MKLLNLIMPMGGGGTRFGNKGFELPKPLIEIYGKPFFFWATQSILKYNDLQSLTFVVLQDHVDRFLIDRRIREFYPDAKIKMIPDILPGAVLTCMAGAEELPPGQPVLFNDCDHLFTCQSFNEFCRREFPGELDGALLTFRSDDPKFSYVRYDDTGEICGTIEKKAVSSDAICGAYYFCCRELFEQSAKAYLENCSYSEFFMSGVYNILAQGNKKIGHFNTDRHVSFGTPEEYEAARDDRTYKMLL